VPPGLCSGGDASLSGSKWGECVLDLTRSGNGRITSFCSRMEFPAIDRVTKSFTDYYKDQHVFGEAGYTSRTRRSCNADEGSRPEKGSSMTMSGGRKASSLARAAFMHMPRDSCLSLRSGKIKVGEKIGGVTGWVEGAKVIRHGLNGHPLGKFLVF
jgi:hypothetical protein